MLRTAPWDSTGGAPAPVSSWLTSAAEALGALRRSPRHSAWRHAPIEARWVAGATKRQTGPAVCRNARQTDAKSGKTRTPYTWPEAGEFPANRPVSDATAARLKIVVSAVRVRLSPSRLSCKCATFAAFCEACEKAGKGRWPFLGSATEGQTLGGHGLARAQEYTMRFVCGCCLLGGSRLRSDR